MQSKFKNYILAIVDKHIAGVAKTACKYIRYIKVILNFMLWQRQRFSIHMYKELDIEAPDGSDEQNNDEIT